MNNLPNKMNFTWSINDDYNDRQFVINKIIQWSEESWKIPRLISDNFFQDEGFLLEVLEKCKEHDFISLFFEHWKFPYVKEKKDIFLFAAKVLLKNCSMKKNELEELFKKHLAPILVSYYDLSSHLNLELNQRIPDYAKLTDIIIIEAKESHKFYQILYKEFVGVIEDMFLEGNIVANLHKNDFESTHEFKSWLKNIMHQDKEFSKEYISKFFPYLPEYYRKDITLQIAYRQYVSSHIKSCPQDFDSILFKNDLLPLEAYDNKRLFLFYMNNFYVDNDRNVRKSYNHQAIINKYFYNNQFLNTLLLLEADFVDNYNIIEIIKLIPEDVKKEKDIWLKIFKKTDFFRLKIKPFSWSKKSNEVLLWCHEQMPKELQSDKDILKQMAGLNVEIAENFGFLLSDLDYLTDSEIIGNIAVHEDIFQNHKDKYKGVRDACLMDKNLFMKIKKYSNLLMLSENEWLKVNKIEGVIQQLMEEMEEIFTLLPVEILPIDIYIEKIKKKSQYIEFLPISIWKNEEFCIKFFDILDNEIDSRLIELVPEHISNFFLSYEVTENFGNFFKTMILKEKLESETTFKINNNDNTRKHKI